ncbi:uncharacterized protein LOC114760308 [Neltuma alba]|uniref:uncharacterized protein LOC114760308 n=1 Tax=Neltuma alba TaxID=207710 RepID=UPI0010A3C82B|nr:uncharacterized protein LOC114760308 [Prosopis alba]
MGIIKFSLMMLENRFPNGIDNLNVYVDDLLLIGSSKIAIQDTKDFLHSNFRIKDLGLMKYFLGMEVAKSESGIILSQRKYVLDMLTDIGMTGCKPLAIPMPQNLKLLPYIEVQTLSQFMQNPTRSHMAVAKSIVRYLKGSIGLGIFLSSEREPELACYCDSDWASCGITRRFVTGYLLKFGGSLVIWKMKKQWTLSKSSAGAEYRALSMATFEITWAL